MQLVGIGDIRIGAQSRSLAPDAFSPLLLQGQFLDDGAYQHCLTSDGVRRPEMTNGGIHFSRPRLFNMDQGSAMRDR
jgi:hypothetical protein